MNEPPGCIKTLQHNLEFFTKIIIEEFQLHIPWFA